jgi:hypothetical protein
MRTRRVVWRPAVTQNDLDEVTGELTRPHWRIKRWQWLCGASNNAPTEDEAELVQHDGTQPGCVNLFMASNQKSSETHRAKGNIQGLKRELNTNQRAY